MELLATVLAAPPVPLVIVLLLELALELLVLLEPVVLVAVELCVPVVVTAVAREPVVFVSVDAVSVSSPPPVVACSELLPQPASTLIKQTARLE